MNRAEENHNYLESLSVASTHTDKAWKLVGLKDMASAWAMYAFVTNRQDEAAYNYLVTRLALVVRRKEPSLKPKSSLKLVEIAIEERLTNKTFSQRLRSVTMSIPRTTFRRKEANFKKLFLLVDSTLAQYETEIRLVGEAKLGLNCGPL